MQQQACVLLTTWFSKYFKPTIKIYYSEKKISSKVLVLSDSALSHSRALVGMDNKINVVFMSVNTIFILQLMGRSNFNFQILLFKKYIL